MTRSEIHPSAVLDHDVRAPHAAIDARAPQPDLGGAPHAADLLRDGLDGLLRDLRPANSTGEHPAQHVEQQQNSRDNDRRGYENTGHTSPGIQDRHDIGNQAHANDTANPGHDNHTADTSRNDSQQNNGRDETGHQDNAGHRNDASHQTTGNQAHENVQAGPSTSFGNPGRAEAAVNSGGASASQPAFGQGNAAATQPSTLAPTSVSAQTSSAVQPAAAGPATSAAPATSVAQPITATPVSTHSDAAVTSQPLDTTIRQTNTEPVSATTTSDTDRNQNQNQTSDQQSTRVAGRGDCLGHRRRGNASSGDGHHPEQFRIDQRRPDRHRRAERDGTHRGPRPNRGGNDNHGHSTRRRPRPVPSGHPVHSDHHHDGEQ
jgi:hypothetical protein